MAKPFSTGYAGVAGFGPTGVRGFANTTGVGVLGQSTSGTGVQGNGGHINGDGWWARAEATSAGAWSALAGASTAPVYRAMAGAPAPACEGMVLPGTASWGWQAPEG